MTLNHLIRVRFPVPLPVSLDILQEMLEDADVYGYIHAGAYADVYDSAAKRMLPKFSKDLSVSQIQCIIWDSFYEEFCIGTVGGTKEPWALDKNQAVFAIGNPEQFKNLAFNIRHSIIGL